MTEYGIRPFPGRCCPEYDCLYDSWDKKHCRGCGGGCALCKLYNNEINRHKEVEAFKAKIKNLYFKTKNAIIEKGHLKEIEFYDNIPKLEDLDKIFFFREYVWVVINSGMKNQVAEGIFKVFWNDNKTYNFNAIKHPNKNEAIKKVYNRLDFYFSHLLQSKNKLKFLKNLPHIGDITKYHLAKNLGLNFAKPDRHLVRIANLFGYNHVQDFCEVISELSHDKIGVVDLVFWRYANLTKNYLEIIEREFGVSQTENKTEK